MTGKNHEPVDGAYINISLVVLSPFYLLGVAKTNYLKYVEFEKQ